MIYEMKLTTEDFEDIVLDRKHIEIRLYDHKRQGISIGDEIDFINLRSPLERVRVRVKSLLREDSFSDLLEKHELSEMTSRFTKFEDYLIKIYSRYTPEKEKKNGILGIEIELIDGNLNHSTMGAIAA
ncbi:MAG: hypothetical protein IH845_03540 [Nanoarchaeota archaeon]|nr:hypothetical protein [Nanoarchaeota archaeon]